MEFQGKVIRGEWKDVELRKNKLWVIVSPLMWMRPSGEIITLTPYLITDYATVPKIFWPVIPKRNEKYDIAAAFHDDCVRHRKLQNISMKTCHNIFKEIMKFNGTPKWQYNAMYTAVTIAGWTSFNKGYGELPWVLTSSEQAKYEQIKREYSWIDLMSNLHYGREIDEFNIF
jgi:hypothetical protein